MARLTDSSDILISIGFAIEDQKALVNTIKNQIGVMKGALKNLKEQKLGSMAGMGIPRKVQAQIRKDFNEQKKLRMEQVKGDIEAAKTKMTAEQGVLNGYRKNLAKGRLAQQKFSNQQKKIRGQFQGWALSIMFFGQMIVRTLTQIWQAGTKVFQDVMHSVEGTVTGFDMLEGSIKYLQFTLGQALEPIAFALFPIIDAISEWILNNDDLIQQLVPMLAILGVLMTTVGTLVLGFAGIATAMKGLLGTSSSLMALGVFAALMALANLTWKAFIETPEAWYAIKESVKQMKPVLDSVVSLFKEMTGLELADWAWGVAWALVSSFRNVLKVVLALTQGWNELAQVATWWQMLMSEDKNSSRYKELKKEYEILKKQHEEIEASASLLASQGPGQMDNFDNFKRTMDNNYKIASAPQQFLGNERTYIIPVEARAREETESVDQYAEYLKTFAINQVEN